MYRLSFKDQNDIGELTREIENLEAIMDSKEFKLKLLKIEHGIDYWLKLVLPYVFYSDIGGFESIQSLILNNGHLVTRLNALIEHIGRNQFEISKGYYKVVIIDNELQFIPETLYSISKDIE